MVTIPKGGRPPSGTIKRTFRIHSDDLERLGVLAEISGETQAGLVQRPLREFLDRALPGQVPMEQKKGPATR